MIFETVITSVPRGLKAGRTGFQPVMRTRGLRDDLLNQLGPLAGYRHVHRQGSGQNPVIFSYRRLSSNIGDLAVIGRTVDAGSDFSNRSNKCGHLIAFTADELGRLSRTTPAAILAGNTSLFAAQWTKGPEERPTPPALTEPPQEPAACTLWQQQFGDAGWAGLVAERARRRQPTMLVAPDCTPQSSELLLGLIREATALLSPGERWAVSFETTVLGSSDSLIQGTYRGSPEAEAPRPGMLVLPLGGPLPQTPLEETALCKLARFGKPRPATPAPPPVTAASSAPPGGDDFLGDELPSPAPGSPPPLVPKKTGWQGGSFEPLPEDKRVPWGTIIGASVSFLLLAFVGIYALIAYSGILNHPNTNPAENKQQNANSETPAAPQSKPADQILRDYAKATQYDEESSPTTPQMDTWKAWLRDTEKDEIDQQWTNFANAVLRQCQKPFPDAFDSNEKWKRHELDFFKAIQKLVNLQPTANDLAFLLLLDNQFPLASKTTDTFIKTALRRYKERTASDQFTPDQIIQFSVHAAYVCNTATRLISGPKPKDTNQPELSPDGFVQQLLSLSGEPALTPEQNIGNLHNQRAELFVESLRHHFNDASDQIDFDNLVELIRKFHAAVKTLAEYAANDISSGEPPTLDDYNRVFCTLPSDLEINKLNAALKSCKKVPFGVEDLERATRRLEAWNHIKSEFEKPPQRVTGQENAFVIAKEIPYFTTIASELIPRIAIPDEASTRFTDNRIWQTTYRPKHDEEPKKCCQFEAIQSANDTDLLIIFPDNKTAKVLSRIPISLEHTGFQQRTASTRISEEPFEYTLSNTRPADPVPTTAEFIADGEKRALKTAPRHGADGIPFTDLLEALGGQQHLSCEFELSKTAEQMGGELSDDGEFSGVISIPTADGPEKEGFKGSELATEIKFSLNAANGLVTLKLNTPNTDPMRPFPKRTVAIGLEKNLLAYASDNKPLILDIAEIVLNIEPKAVDKKAELKEYLSYIANNQNFGSPNDWFGNEPLRGPNAQIFPTQDFTSPKDSTPTQTNRRLIGRSEYKDLSKRSWEMTFASFLVKASQEFKEKRTGYDKPVTAEIEKLKGEIDRLRKNTERNREQIQKIEQRIKQEQENVRKPIGAWLTSGWVAEIDAIISKLDPDKVRLDKSDKEDEKTYRERVRICKDLYSKLRPFVARYLIAFHDEEAKKVTLDSLVEVTLLYKTPDGGQIEIAKILPSENAPPEQPTDQGPAPGLPATKPN